MCADDEDEGQGNEERYSLVSDILKVGLVGSSGWVSDRCDTIL